MHATNMAAAENMAAADRPRHEGLAQTTHASAGSCGTPGTPEEHPASTPRVPQCCCRALDSLPPAQKGGHASTGKRNTACVMLPAPAARAGGSARGRAWARPPASRSRAPGRGPAAQTRSCAAAGSRSSLSAAPDAQRPCNEPAERCSWHKSCQPFPLFPLFVMLKPPASIIYCSAAGRGCCANFTQRQFHAHARTPSTLTSHCRNDQVCMQAAQLRDSGPPSNGALISRPPGSSPRLQVGEVAAHAAVPPAAKADE